MRARGHRHQRPWRAGERGPRRARPATAQGGAAPAHRGHARARADVRARPRATRVDLPCSAASRRAPRRTASKTSRSSSTSTTRARQSCCTSRTSTTSPRPTCEARRRRRRAATSRCSSTRRRHRARGVPFDDGRRRHHCGRCATARREFGVTWRLILCFLRHRAGRRGLEMLELALPYRRRSREWGSTRPSSATPRASSRRCTRRRGRQASRRRPRRRGGPARVHRGRPRPAQGTSHRPRRGRDRGPLAAVGASPVWARALTMCPLCNLELQVTPDLLAAPAQEAARRRAVS